MAFPDRLRLPIDFDPVLLRRDLDFFSADEWIPHFVTQNYEGDWSVVPLRGPAGATHPVQSIYSDPTCEHFEDTPFLQRCEYLTRVLRSFRCPLHAARLMKLGAGSRILEHTDYDLEAETGVARLHVPITTDDAVDFRLNGERVVLRAGECWYLRLSDPHRVENRSAADRVHLVIDATVDPWLRALLDGSAPSLG
jgi:hypothetical protein